MTASMRALCVLIAAAAALAVPTVVFATGEEHTASTSAAKRANLYINRASFNNAGRSGVLETLSRINAASPKMEVLISVHGLTATSNIR